MGKKMAEKVLIIDNNEWEDGTKGMTQLVGNPKDETFYAEYGSNNGGETVWDTIELAVNIKQMIEKNDLYPQNYALSS